MYSSFLRNSFSLLPSPPSPPSLPFYPLPPPRVYRYTPDIFIDTTGFAFSFFVAAIAGCRVTTYTHYPTISTDMLSVVRVQILYEMGLYKSLFK